MKNGPKKRKLVLLAVTVLVLAATAGFVFRPRLFPKTSGDRQTDSKAPDRIYTAKKGELILGVMLTGSVNAKTKHKLAMEAPWGTKLESRR